MASPYVEAAAKRARVLGAGSEPEKMVPRFLSSSEEAKFFGDPTMPDDVLSEYHVKLPRGGRKTDYLIATGFFILLATIAFGLGWLAVSHLGH